MEENILTFINNEIDSFNKERKLIPEKYRDVKPTIKNQELRIKATLSTLKSIKSYVEECIKEGKE